MASSASVRIWNRRRMQVLEFGAVLIIALCCIGCETRTSIAESAPGQQRENPRFEYLVCQSQDGRITWVNGVWAGTKEGELPKDEEISTCPQTWDFLNEKGAEGWELVSVAAVNTVYDQVEYDYLRLYLKRAAR